eukprot:TRINITY_DN3792_c0_g1_i3.p1 TRINITY_DN3792_c0_g1~~TRINITY_DN3792_c0_g1_i3.p1  ORF type:complete len:163 (-),score=38.56 TRINITY_DN3792_c0_g1_i3:621-1109(-)
MSCRGKGGKGKSRSSRAGLQFPVGRIHHRLLRRGNYSEHVSAGAAIYLAAVMEYLAARLLELAGNTASDNKQTTAGDKKKTTIFPCNFLQENKEESVYKYYIQEEKEESYTHIIVHEPPASPLQLDTPPSSPYCLDSPPFSPDFTRDSPMSPDPHLQDQDLG